MPAMDHRDHVEQYDNIILDLSDVLFTWVYEETSPIAPDIVRRMFHSLAWFELEKGNIGQEECYALLASEFSLSVPDISTTIQAGRVPQMRDRTGMTSFLQDLKEKAPRVRIFAMSNLPYSSHLQIPSEDIFDQVFISAASGERKPNFAFYRHVLESTGIDPRRTVFIDSKVEDVLVAMSLGMKGVVFTTVEDVALSLKVLLRDPLVDAEKWMLRHAGTDMMWSVSDTGITVKEIFSQLLILELTRDKTLPIIVECPRYTNFFLGDSVLTTPKYPYDLDTTSLACTVLDSFSPALKHEIMDEMLLYKNADGIIQVYFDKSRPRVDACICVNILTFFHANGREDDLTETLDWICAILQNRAFEHGTLYYLGGDTFLFFLSRLLRVSPSVRERVGQAFVTRIRERLGMPGDALALAMRILTAASVGLPDTQDYERLLLLQEDDGAWPSCSMYKFGISGVRICNKGLTTAMAVAAIRRYKEHFQVTGIDFHKVC